MIFRQLFDRDTSTFTYLVGDPSTRHAVLIDPVIAHVQRDLRLIEDLGLKLEYVLDTHVHADHVTGAGEIRERTGAKTGLSANAGVGCADLSLADGQRLSLGTLELEARTTPGHTSGCMSFVLHGADEVMVFTGDALLIRGCGRTDFQQGDSATLYRSVREKIFSLPPETRIYPGHDYRGFASSTVEEERRLNPRLRDGVDEAMFVETMASLKLAHPKRIHEALPANLSCGTLAPTEAEPAPPFASLAAKDIARFDRGFIVDVRTEAEFSDASDRLPNALSVPLDRLEETAHLWVRNVPILAVCRSGGRSSKACAILKAMGFDDITNLEGGMLGVRAAGALTGALRRGKGESASADSCG